MASLTPWLAYSGARKVDGTPAASGTVYFFVPGTTNTQAVVYSDKDGLTAITQPLTLDAAGRGEAYTKVACRIHVLDSLGNLVKVLDRSNTVASGQVEIEVTGFTGTDLTTGSQTSGGRTDLAAVLASAYTSTGGTNFYIAPTGATGTIKIKDALPWFTPQMFGALGDNNNDDTTAFQATITAAISYGKKVKVPPGTYRISSALTIGTKGVVIEGESRDDCILKNMSTSANVFTIDLLSAIDSKITIRDLSITASTTSSGSAITVTNGDRIRIENIAVALHRTSIDVNAVSGAIVKDCVIESTDDNASAMGINLGARGRATNCEVISGTVNGTGIKLTGADARVTDCFTTKFVTAVSMAGARGLARGVHTITATTGFSVGAVAYCVVTGCYGSGNTTDLSVNASATFFDEYSNSFATITNTAAPPGVFMGNRRIATEVTVGTGSVNYTPVISAGARLCVIRLPGSLSAFTLTAPSTTNIQFGEEFEVLITNESGGALASGITLSGFLGPVTSNTPVVSSNFPANTTWRLIFRCYGSQWRLIGQVITNSMSI